MLCGCGSNSDKAKETISEIYEQTESVKPQAHYGISKNVYMVRHNEDDTYDYSPILGNVSISEDDSVIAYGTTIECSWMDDSAIIPCRLMIFVDGVPIKFGLEYGKSDYYSEVEIANNKNSITRLYLDEESLKKVNSKIDLEIMCIPMADNTEWNNENIVYSVFDEITEKYKDKNVLVVFHGAVSILSRYYFEKDVDVNNFYYFGLDNCEVKEYDI